MSKTVRTVFAVLWGVFALPAAFFALVIYGLARMDVGWVTPEPQLIALWVLPVTLIVSCIVEIWAARGADTSQKAQWAKVFAFLPVGNILIIAALILAR